MRFLHVWSHHWKGQLSLAKPSRFSFRGLLFGIPSKHVVIRTNRKPTWLGWNWRIVSAPIFSAPLLGFHFGSVSAPLLGFHFGSVSAPLLGFRFGNVSLALKTLITRQHHKAPHARSRTDVTVRKGDQVRPRNWHLNYSHWLSILSANDPKLLHGCPEA